MIKSLTSLLDLNMRTGADILLEVLESEGVEYIFGNPGTTELPLIDALLRHENIHYILALQESTVVAIADGYAKASGKTGFINLHTASGLGHGMGNLINSRIMKTPLVVTVGQQDTRHYVRDPLLYDDIVSIGSPVMKWAGRLLLNSERISSDAWMVPSFSEPAIRIISSHWDSIFESSTHPRASSFRAP